MNIPGHIAIIMDGNGRWARKQGMRRVLGHEKGSAAVRRITEECSEMGVKRLTLYAFSSDNWKRPEREVKFLWKLLKKYLVSERVTIKKNNIRFRAIGRLDALPKNIQMELKKTKDLSAGNSGMVLCLALNYGGRNEILDAVKRLGEEVQRGALSPDQITESLFSKYLYDPDAEDPDLLIRTGGDVRVSNFLLWQISYTELWVTPVMWPEFTLDHLHQAIREFSGRERRYGGIGS